MPTPTPRTFWDRKVRIEMGIPGSTDGVAFDENFRIEFDVTRTDRGDDPDAATVTIFNLSATTRKRLSFLAQRALSLYEQARLNAGDQGKKSGEKTELTDAGEQLKGVETGSGVGVLRIFAGYGDELRLLYQGDVLEGGVRHEVRGVDVLTTIDAADGGRVLLTDAGHVAASFAANSPLDTAVQAVADLTGISETVIRDLPAVSAIEGMAFDDTAADVFDTLAGEYEVAAGVPVDWTIQNGTLTFAPRASTLGIMVELGPETGLINSPTESTDDDGVVSVEATSLLNPLLMPRVPLELTSRLVSGRYRIRQVQHHGASYGGEFYSEVIAVAI